MREEAGDRLFLNARIDTFIRGVDDPGAAIERAAAYVAAGADCVYPIAAPTALLPLLRSGIQGPVNVFARPGRGPHPPNSAGSGPPGSRSGPVSSGMRSSRCGRPRQGSRAGP